LDADALAASGVPLAQLVGLRAAAATHAAELAELQERQDALHAAESALRAARDEIARSGQSEAREAAVQSAESAYQSAQFQKDQTLTTVRGVLSASVEDDLAPHDYGMLQRSVVNQGRDVPAEYRVLQLTEVQWADLESALKRSRSAAPSLSGSEQDVLEFANSNADVQLARQRLALTGSAMQAALAQAIADEVAQSN